MNAPHPTVALKKERLDRLREMLELDTDYRLAQAIGISQSNVSRILAGKQQPGPRFMAALCNATKATLNDLFEIRDVAA